MTETKTPIKYIDGMQLEEHQKYIVDCGIEFVYSPVDDETKKEKPYLLNNGYRLNHIPTTKDIPTNNLDSFANKDKDKLREMCSKGGKKSQEVQRNRRTFKESMSMVLSIKASKDMIESLPDTVQEYLKSEGIEATIEDIINIKASLMAMDGSVQHAIFSRDTVGEKPTDRQEITAEVMTDADKLLIEKLSKRLQDNKQ